MHAMLVTLVLTPALLPSSRTLAPSSAGTHVRHPRPSAILWDELSTELDASVPVYVVANQAGRPLEYESSGRSLFLCYVDPSAAQAALEAAIGLYPALGLRLLPTGLGSAISKANEGGALLIPAAADLQAAQAAYPDGEDWEGGQLLTSTLALALALAPAPAPAPSPSPSPSPSPGPSPSPSPSPNQRQAPCRSSAASRCSGRARTARSPRPSSSG